MIHTHQRARQSALIRRQNLQLEQVAKKDSNSVTRSCSGHEHSAVVQSLERQHVAAYSAAHLHMMAENTIYDLDLRPFALFLYKWLQPRHQVSPAGLHEPLQTPKRK